MTLLADIEKFLEDTGMPTTTFGLRNGLTVSFVLQVRKGRKVGERLSEVCRKFMAENQDWKPQPKKTPGRKAGKKQDDRSALHPRDHLVRKSERDQNLWSINRDLCGFCGIRKDVGCPHYEKSEPVRIG